MERKHLFATLLLLLCIISFVSCVKEEDDTRTTCTSGCTVIMGRILTSENQPLPGINFEVNYKKTTGIHYILTRKKAVTESDKDGFYDMRFHLKDDELLQDESYRTFEMNINLERLDPELYILPKDMISHIDASTDPPTTTAADVAPEITASMRLKRDTVYDVNCYVPQKKYIKVTLKGFKPQQKGDCFEVCTLFPWGFEENDWNDKMLDTKYGIGGSGWDRFKASTEDQTFTEVPFALNDSNIVRIIKVKNGVAMPEDHKIYVSGDSPTNLTYEY